MYFCLSTALNLLTSPHPSLLLLSSSLNTTALCFSALREISQISGCKPTPWSYITTFGLPITLENEQQYYAWWNSPRHSSLFQRNKKRAFFCSVYLHIIIIHINENIQVCINFLLLTFISHQRIL